MAEIEFRLPSKVPYGYVNLVFSEEHVPDPAFLGRMYANYVMAFAESERAALDAYGKPSEAPSAPRESEVEQSPSTEEAVHETAVQAVSEGLGATVVDELNQAPWEKQASAPQPKPWEKKTTADTVAPKAAAVIDWRT